MLSFREVWNLSKQIQSMLFGLADRLGISEPPESEQQEQDGPEPKYISSLKCEKCDKIGAYMIIRDGAVHYLCENCLENWEGNL